MVGLRRWITVVGLGGLAHLLAACAAVPGAARAQVIEPAPASIELPGRVGRLADLDGEVWVYDEDEGAWVAAGRNRPLTTGDRLSVDGGGRAEVRIGPTVLHLDGGTDLELLALDEARIHLQLHAGSLALRVPTAWHAGQTRVFTREGQFEPLSAGLYRFDREPDRDRGPGRDIGTSHAAVWRGEMMFRGEENLRRVEAGERVRVWLDPLRGVARTGLDGWPQDGFGAWVLAADRRLADPPAYRYVSPEMTGAEDLDRYGRWDTHPEFGMVWVPIGVAASWAPYRDGRWVWHAAWGWTWRDAQPWGFAPFHYGRWVNWRGRWCWWPGERHAFPRFAPALVATVGGPQVGLSIVIGGRHRPPPPAHWVPLAPHQAYVPIHRPPPRHWHPVRPPPAPHAHDRNERRHDRRDDRRDHRTDRDGRDGHEGRPVFADRPQRPDRPDRWQRPDSPDGPGRWARPEPAERTERPDRPDRPDRQTPAPRFVAPGGVPGGAAAAAPATMPVPAAPSVVVTTRPPPGRDPADRPGRIERPEGPARLDRPDRPERVARPDYAEAADRPERPERPTRIERPERPERAERPERFERPERPERPERADRPERPERAERAPPFRVGSPERAEPRGADERGRPERRDGRADPRRRDEMR